MQILDANGDGRADLMVSDGTISGYFPLDGQRGWDVPSFQRYTVAPSFNLKDPEVHLIDLDGDGVTDAIRSSTRFEYFIQSETGWTQTGVAERTAVESFPNITFSDPRVKWGDMSGDGLQDPVLVEKGSVTYWPNLGRGKWGRRVHMANSPRLPYEHNPKRILVGDVDGDGLADLVYVDDTSVTLWINNSGNSWSGPIVVHGTPSVSDLDSLRLVDLMGTGIAGILWSADATLTSLPRMFFLDFAGGQKPYLLDRLDNHIGGQTKVTYWPSTQCFLTDQVRPETRWKTSLPFLVQVVASVNVSDAFSGGTLTTEYGYHHGYWDGLEREFRGFGRVNHRDTEVFEATQTPSGTSVQPVPPIETITWFHLGPIDDGPGKWHEEDFSSEFFRHDPPMLPKSTELKSVLDTLQSNHRRDAIRTLRGSV